MQLKHYGIFDSVSGDYVRTFTATNDEEAKRAAEYVVRENGFDDVAGKDRSIHYLFTLDTSNGAIVDNQVHIICNLSTFIEARKHQVREEEVTKQVMKKEFLDELKELVLFEVQKGIQKDGKCDGNKA